MAELILGYGSCYLGGAMGLALGCLMFRPEKVRI